MNHNTGKNRQFIYRRSFWLARIEEQSQRTKTLLLYRAKIRQKNGCVIKFISKRKCFFGSSKRERTTALLNTLDKF